MSASVRPSARVALSLTKRTAFSPTAPIANSGFCGAPILRTTATSSGAFEGLCHLGGDWHAATRHRDDDRALGPVGLEQRGESPSCVAPVTKADRGSAQDRWILDRGDGAGPSLLVGRAHSAVG